MLVFCSISNVVIIFHIGKKNWKDLQPIHYHQVNYFLNIFLVSLFGLLVLPGDKLSVRGFCPVILGSYFLSIDNVYSIIILQIDRYIAVRFPYLYKSKVDVSVTIKTIIAAKIFSLLNVLISTIVDPVFLLCPLCSRCIYVHSVNIYTVSYPSLAAIVLTIFVSIYVSIKANALNDIQPMIGRPLPLSVLTNDTLVPSTSTSQDINENRTNSPANNENNFDSFEQLNVTNMIKQLDQVDHRVSSPQVLQSEKKMMKNTLKMNLLTLALLLIVIPIQVLTILYKDCDIVKGECDKYFSSMVIISIVQLIIGCVHPIVVIITLELHC